MKEEFGHMFSSWNNGRKGLLGQKRRVRREREREPWGKRYPEKEVIWERGGKTCGFICLGNAASFPVKATSREL
jgi:hypothetical protein